MLNTLLLSVRSITYDCYCSIFALYNTCLQFSIQKKYIVLKKIHGIIIFSTTSIFFFHEEKAPHTLIGMTFYVLLCVR